MKRVLILFCVFVILSFFVGCSPDTNVSKETLNIAQESLIGYDEIINIYDVGNISDDENEIVLDEDKYEYYVVKNKKYKSIDDLKKSTQKVLSYNFSCSYFFRAFTSEERPLYKEIDGKLCRTVGDMTVLYTPQKSDIIIHQNLKDLIVFSVPPTEGNALTKTHRYYFTILNTHEGWRIDNIFELE